MLDLEFLEEVEILILEGLFGVMLFLKANGHLVWREDPLQLYRLGEFGFLWAVICSPLTHSSMM